MYPIHVTKRHARYFVPITLMEFGTDAWPHSQQPHLYGRVHVALSEVRRFTETLTVAVH